MFPILFDLDGTLTDSKTGIIHGIQYALTSLGYASPPDEALHWALGPPLSDSFSKLLPDARLIPRAIELYRERYREKGMYENEVYPGIEVALKTLKETGATLYVATSKNEPAAVSILEHFGLAGHFDGIHGATLDGSRGAKADIIAHCLATHGLDPTRAQMIGDRHHDIHGALANHVRPIGVAWGYGSREELKEAGAVRICDQPSELSDILND